MITTLLAVHQMFLHQSPSHLDRRYIHGLTASDMLKKQVLSYLQTSRGRSDEVISVLAFKRFLKSFKWIMEEKVNVYENKTKTRRFVCVLFFVKSLVQDQASLDLQNIEMVFCLFFVLFVWDYLS